VLLAFGGNGPVHAAEVARQLGITAVVVPPWPGLFSAFGLLAAETRHELSQAHRAPLASLSPADLRAGLGALEQAARAALRDEGHPDAAIEIAPWLDLRYRGQSSELRVPVGRLESVGDRDAVVAAFEREHVQTYGFHDVPERVELASYRIVASVPDRMPPPQVEPRTGPAGQTRLAYFGQERGALQTPVVGRGDLTATPSPGPLIVVE
jgi:N-methylhydantoinase A